MMNASKNAFTLVEVIVVIVLLLLLTAASWHVYNSSRRNAREIMLNQELNESVDMVLMKIIEDVREANSIASSSPPIYELSEIPNLKTENSENRLSITKVTYDFKDSQNGLLSHSKNNVTFFLEREDTTVASSSWVLIREMTPINPDGTLVESEIEIRELLSGIEDCVFYRVKNPNASRAGNIFVRLKLSRRSQGESKSQYENDTIVCIKERAALP